MPQQPLTFYTHPHSRGRISRWALEETGLHYQTEYLDYGTTMKSPDYLAINPMGKVPALRHGDVVITENAAIAMHLADLVPEKQLAPPAGNPERGSYYRWISFMGPLEQRMMAKHAGALGQPMSAGYGGDTDVIDVLTQVLDGREFIVGNRFTFADLMVAGYLGFYRQFRMLEASPVFDAYVDRHLARDARKRADDIDDAIIAEANEGGGAG